MTKGLWHRIKQVALTDVGVLVKGLDRHTLEEFERIMIEADFGPVAFELAEGMEDQLRRGALRTPDAVRMWLKQQAVILVLGVNGVGKTTQIAKIAHRLQRQGNQVLLAAADTYRAGASEQLKIWADRLNADCIVGVRGGDPAAVAYDAVDAASARRADIVLIDTAGRLHTHGDLMKELQKIARVVNRRRDGAPQETLLVLDGTVGQNALQQGRAFSTAVPVSGLVITKLDGTAKGGAVLLIRRR